MKWLNVSEFREQCLILLDKLPSSGVVITRRGKPVAKLVPYKGDDMNPWIGLLKGKITIKGDILSTGTRWDAEP